jgi:serine/threonine protein kinase
MVGKTISHYKILEKLGEGGMGVVYKAEDLKLKRIVALKFLPPELTRDPEAKERFIQEAQAASALDHPNICTIHEIDETVDGQLFIVMACYDGETLKKKIASSQSREAGLSMDSVIDIAIQIAQGLVKAHEHGIFHRDIKPGNIMITKDGMVKILDFGLAKLAGQVGLTKTGTTVGTIAYMSPEQARGEDVDHRTDIWSFGVVLYEMVSGKLPFRGEYDQAVVYSIMNEQPEPLIPIGSETSGVHLELERIVGTCLEKQAAHRYQSSEQVLADLKRLHRDIDTETSRTAKSVAAPQAKQKKRRTAIVALAAVLFVMMASYLGYILTSKEIEVDDKTVAIMYIENQTGEGAYGQQAILIIPQIYQQLFAKHKDIILPSNQI